MASPPTTTADAKALVEDARKLMDRIVNGYILDDHKIKASSADATDKFEVAAVYFEAQGDRRMMAEVQDDIGFLAMHDGFNQAKAPPHLLRAAELYAELGEPWERLETLLDLSEIDPYAAVIAEAVDNAIAAGLPSELRGEVDPLRLFAKLRDERKLDDAMALLDKLDAEAETRGDKARMAKLLNARAVTQDMWLKDRKGALDSAEKSLALARDVGDKDEILSALLMLVDLHLSRGAKKQAKVLFDKAEKIRGVRKSLRDMRKVMAMHFKS